MAVNFTDTSELRHVGDSCCGSQGFRDDDDDNDDDGGSGGGSGGGDYDDRHNEIGATGQLQNGGHTHERTTALC